MTSTRTLLLATLLLWSPAHSVAGLIGYSQQSDFLAALPGAAAVYDFESFAAGMVLPDAVDSGGITFNYGPDFGTEHLIVSDVFETTSGSNFLGTDLDDLLAEDFNDFSLTFAAPVNAVGMYFISADDLLDGDITLVNPSGSISLVATDVFQLPGGDNVYFLGLIDTAAFTTIAISTPGLGGAFFYNVDDILTARQSSPNEVPEPTSLALMAIGGAISLAFARRGKPPKTVG